MRNAEETAKRLVELNIRFHTEWRGLRSSLIELVFSDPEARKFFRKQRRRQLELITELRARFALPAQTSEQDAILLWTTERVFDAIGQGEIQSLGLNKDAIVEFWSKKCPPSWNEVIDLSAALRQDHLSFWSPQTRH